MLCLGVTDESALFHACPCSVHALSMQGWIEASVGFSYPPREGLVGALPARRLRPPRRHARVGTLRRPPRGCRRRCLLLLRSPLPGRATPCNGFRYCCCLCRQRLGRLLRLQLPTEIHIQAATSIAACDISSVCAAVIAAMHLHTVASYCNTLC